MFTSRSAAETQEFAAQFARELKVGDVLALCGELGSGKTQFVKGLARGLGSGDVVTSPTFTIVHEYSGGRLPLYHFDFYRLENIDALCAIDFDDYFAASGVCAIEWADKLPGALPKFARWIHFVSDGEVRSIDIAPASA